MLPEGRDELGARDGIGEPREISPILRGQVVAHRPVGPVLPKERVFRGLRARKRREGPGKRAARLGRLSRRRGLPCFLERNDDLAGVDRRVEGRAGLMGKKRAKLDDRLGLAPERRERRPTIERDDRKERLTVLFDARLTALGLQRRQRVERNRITTAPELVLDLFQQLGKCRGRKGEGNQKRERGQPKQTGHGSNLLEIQIVRKSAS